MFLLAAALRAAANGGTTQGDRTMRKLIMWNLITLDGFFEGTKSWDLDWH
jgi:hypothetical protein